MSTWKELCEAYDIEAKSSDDDLRKCVLVYLPEFDRIRAALLTGGEVVKARESGDSVWLGGAIETHARALKDLGVMG